MTKNANEEAPERQKSLWFRIGQFLFVVVLAVAFYLLGLSMVHHRFFRGGYINQHGVLKP
jgi:flagellar basal body-associated protein FliL